jgi:hypothetical protein
MGDPADRIAASMISPRLRSASALFLLVGLTGSTRAAQIAGPELFEPGVISTPLDELNTMFTPDGRELYFTLNAFQNRLGSIVVSRRENGRWGRPEMASFSGQYTDYDPFIAPDGKRLFFISNRPVAGTPRPPGDFDIWYADRTGSGWGEPVHLDGPVNSDRPEYYPSVTRDGTLYFSTVREGSNGFDIFRSRLVDGKYQAPENLGPEVNGTGRTAEIDVYVAPDESFIVFASYGRPDELGGGDLYISHRTESGWTPAKNLGPGVNSPAREYCPAGTVDGKYFYWTSKRGFADQPLSRKLSFGELTDSLRSVRNGEGNIYRVPLARVTGVR